MCSDLTTIQNTVGIYILQHPRERRHALGTVRLLRHGLANVQVHTLDLLGDGGRSRVIDLPTGAGLLYPTKDARDLATLNPDERPSHLVIIDGTWAHANRHFQDNPWLSHRPAFKLPPHGGSRYRIRPEPRHECLSTAESVIEALRCLEPQLKGTESLRSGIRADDRRANRCFFSRRKARSNEAGQTTKAPRNPGGFDEFKDLCVRRVCRAFSSAESRPHNSTSDAFICDEPRR